MEPAPQPNGAGRRTVPHPASPPALEAASMLAAIVDNSGDAIIGNSLDDIILSWNRGAERLFGYAAAEVLGRHVSILYPPDQADEWRSISARIRRGEQVPGYETRRRRKDGALLDVSATASLIVDQKDQIIGSCQIARDLSDKRRLEEQFRQAQKMEAVGQLAGGVAHDFNNLLTLIFGYSEMLANTLPADDPMRSLLEEMENAGERAASLTRQLLAFSRHSVPEPRVLDLNQIVADSSKMLRRLVGEDIELITFLEPDLGQVKADPSQIEQVVLNLVVNAREAMPQGGHLLLETANTELDECYGQLYPEVTPGRYVMLSVSDTGHGMDEETKAHIFEPFFTTKGPGKGTGLGLAMVCGVVKQSGGHIAVYSERGLGTTFKVYLPRIQGAALSGERHGGMRSMPPGHETVLLVEDENAVRTLAHHVLTSCGYRVLEASQGDEALRVAEKYPRPIHLLVTDVVLPLMGGRLVAERVAALKPSIKVLYLSGYTDDAVVRHGVLESETAFLHKPFSPTALAVKVREVLDQAVMVAVP